MNKLCVLIVWCLLTGPLFSQDPASWISTLPQAKDYVQHRASSYDRSGANADAHPVARLLHRLLRDAACLGFMAGKYEFPVGAGSHAE